MRTIAWTLDKSRCDEAAFPHPPEAESAPCDCPLGFVKDTNSSNDCIPCAEGTYVDGDKCVEAKPSVGEVARRTMTLVGQGIYRNSWPDVRYYHPLFHMSLTLLRIGEASARELA